MFKLERPIAFFDLETTGTDVEKDRIIDISISVISDLDKPDESLNYHWRVNPGMSIPKEASDVHGITDDMVKTLGLFKTIASEVSLAIDGCDLAGFNSNKFDVPMLYNELERAGIILDYKNRNLLDVGNLFKIREPRTLTAAVKFYNDRDHEDAHGSSADVRATVDVFIAQLNKYSDLPESVSELSKVANYDRDVIDIHGKFSRDKDGDYVYTFGKNKDKKVRDDLSYVDWILNKSDFGTDTKNVLRDILKEINSPKKKEEQKQIELF